MILSAKEPKTLEKAVDILKNGGIVVFPTETVYGIGALYNDEKAVKRIYEIKGRDFSKPLLIHMSRSEDVNLMVDDVPEVFFRLTERFWPGPLSIILNASASVPKAAISGGTTVGFRMPSDEFFIKLSNIVGPIAATSANVSGGSNPKSVEDAHSQLGELPDLYVDGGIVGKGLPSTIIDLTVIPSKFLRIGAISEEEVRGIMDL